MCQSQPQLLQHFAEEAKVMVIIFRQVSWAYVDSAGGSHDPPHPPPQALSIPDPGLAWFLTSSSHFLGFMLGHEKELPNPPSKCSFNMCTCI